MVKYREILRLASLGVSQRNVADSCGCARSTVQSILQAAERVGLEWPLPDEWDDSAIRQRLFPPKAAENPDKAPMDFEHIDAELKKRSITMTLLWSEYCETALSSGLQPFQYSAFCNHYRKWALSKTTAMHIEWKPGEQMQVDWVGDTMEVCDPDTGEVHRVYVFVACLPFSSLIFVEGFYTMNQEAWIDAHIHAFNFFGGTTPILVPDNCKTGVIKNTVSEPVLNDQYRRMAEYYGCAVIPARPRRPKDKASVEMNVGVVERQAIAPIRNRRFLSLADLNQALQSRVDCLNDRPFQKREGSRNSTFLTQEKQMLLPLPTRPFEMSVRKRATVNFNYHIAFEGVWYSVPFSFVRREVEVVATAKSVAINCDGNRIALHKRSYMQKGAYVTNTEHMPDTHRDFVEWNGDRFRKWADEIGASTAKVIDGILRSRKIEQQSYRSCRGVLTLRKTHGTKLLEEACTKALLYSMRPSYKTVKSIISTLAAGSDHEDQNEHAYIRGAEYYENL